MKKTLRSLVVAIAVAWHAPLLASEHGQPLLLPSGEMVHIERIDKIWAGGTSEWVLLITYGTDNLDDIQELVNRAKLIWPYIEALANEQNVNHAGIKASIVLNSKEQGVLTKTKRRGYSVGFTKHSDGSWRLNQ